MIFVETSFMFNVCDNNFICALNENTHVYSLFANLLEGEWKLR
jgi:hypothetical protein